MSLNYNSIPTAGSGLVSYASYNLTGNPSKANFLDNILIDSGPKSISDKVLNYQINYSLIGIVAKENNSYSS